MKNRLSSLPPWLRWASLLGCLAIGRTAAATSPVFWLQEGEIPGSAPDERFGSNVAVSGDLLVVGIRNATSSGGLTGAGEARVYRRTLGSWGLIDTLWASDAGQDDNFGVDVAIEGTTIIVGAPYWDQGTENDDRGAVYVFELSGTQWGEVARLEASSTKPSKHMGGHLALSGDTVVAGAPSTDLATGASGAISEGAAFVFTRAGGTWGIYESAWMNPPLPHQKNERNFGECAIDGDTIVIGGRGNAGGPANLVGYAYIYEEPPTGWAGLVPEIATLSTSGGAQNDEFGGSIAIEGGTVVVGAAYEDDTYGNVDAGAVYVFDEPTGGWSGTLTETVHITPGPGPGSEPVGYFGLLVDISGDTIVTGSGYFDSLMGATDAGGAFVYSRAGSQWIYLAGLLPDDAPTNGGAPDYFGNSVAIDGVTIAIGANGHDHGGVQDTGGVYVFRSDIYTIYCTGEVGDGTPCPCNNDNDGTLPGAGCANGVFTSGARLAASGISSVSADTLVLTSTHLEPSNSGLYFQGENQVNGGAGLVWNDGLRCAGGFVIRLQVRFSDALGTSFTTVGIAQKGQVSAGDRKRYQCWYRTTNNPPCGTASNTTNGVEILWGP